jgi:hypothetical protein
MTREAENPDREGSKRSDARASHWKPPRRERGDGSIFQKRYTDKKTGKTRKTSMLYMKFYVGGKPQVEPTGTTKLTKARKILRQNLGEIATGRYIPADVDKTTFGQIKDMLVNHYRANARKSLDRVEDALTHLEAFFGLTCRVRDIATDRITAYVAARRNEEAANATINSELAALKLMLRLGERAGKVINRPYIGMLEENNKRKGFFEADQCEAVLRYLSADLKPVFEVAYITGWRVKDEILTRQQCHLDLKAGWLRLEPGEITRAACFRSRRFRGSATSWRVSSRGPSRSRRRPVRSSPGSSTVRGSPSSRFVGRGLPHAGTPRSPVASRTTSGGRPSATWNGPASLGRRPWRWSDTRQRACTAATPSSRKAC